MSARSSLTLTAIATGCLQIWAPASFAQSADRDLEEIVVVGNRSAQSVRDVPRSVTVIGQEQIREQLGSSVDVADLLGRLVPGMPTSADGRNNARGQDQIRGRRFLLLIDGVPQDRTFLDTRQDFKSVSPEAIERIEVIRGGTAIYGLNSTGGIINIITKRGRPGPPQVTSTLRILPFNGEGLGWNLYNQIGGGNERIQYFIGLDLLRSEGRADARGNLIPSATVGSADFNSTQNLNIKVGAGLGEASRIEYTLNYFRSEDHARFYPCRGILPAQGTLPLTSRFNTVGLCGSPAPTAATAPSGGQVAQAVQIPVGADEPGNAAAANAANARPYGFEIANHAVTLEAQNTRLGDLTTTLYHQTRSAVTASFNFTRSAQNPPSGQVLGFGFNDLKHSRTGLRTTVDSTLSSLGKGAKLVWGLDAEMQDFSQPNNLGLTPTSPDYKQSTLAPFGQLDVPLGPWRLSGGMRYERIHVDIPTFQTPLSAAVSQRTVQGGGLTFAEPLFNAGAVYTITPHIQAFGSFSQGLTLGEMLRAIRSTTKFTVADTVADVQPVKVDAYELGLRGFSRELRWSAVAFFNTSPLGATITRDPTTQAISTVRAPEEVYGAEGTIDWDFAKGWRAGGSISIQEGSRTLNGVKEALPGTRIAPLKVVGFLRHNWNRDQFAQLDMIHTASRNKFADGRVNSVFSSNVVGGDAEGAGRVDAVTLFNLSYGQKLGPGRMTVALINVLNTFYIPPTLQALNDPRAYYAGMGRAVSASYTVNW